MAEMTMIEDGDLDIYWKCSACEALIKDRDGFEDKVKKCPKCGEKITAFNSLFDEEDEENG